VKIRADLLLTRRNLVNSREKAKMAIEKSLVFANGKLVKKPSELIDEEVEIILKSEPLRYVGKGGLKLEKALNVFKINVSGLICMDIGASTGGFTDCMLQNGAKKVYAVDVGENQLDKSLLSDSRVINMEKTNIKDIDLLKIKDKIDFITVDVSFISLKWVLPEVYRILRDNGSCVCLIKPQFEIGKELLPKSGVVRDRKLHKKVLTDVLKYINDNKFSIKNIDFSPIMGSKGNIEYLAYIYKSSDKSNFNPDIISLINSAFDFFKNGGSK